MNTKIKKIMLGAPALGAMGIGAVSTVASCSRNPGVESITKITFAPKFVEQFDDNIQQINQRCLAGYQYNSIAPVVYDQQGKDVTDKCSLAIRDQDRSFLNNVGLTFSDGVISGTPSIAVTTTHKIELFAYYEKLEPASITFDFTISANTIRFNDEYPNITCYTSKTMTPTKQITVYDVRHTDVQSQCTYALLDASGETATLPTGLNFNSSTGVVSGTPPSESSSMTNLRIQATYNGQTTFSESFNLDVKLNTFRFASNYGDDNGCINYESGDNFSHKYKPVIWDVEHDDINDLCNFTLNLPNGENLPSGLTFNTEDGSFTATNATYAQISGVTITATYDERSMTSGTFNINQPSIHFSQENYQKVVGYTGHEFSATPPVIIDTNGDVVTSGLTFSNSLEGPYPEGLSFDTSTGVFYGNVTASINIPKVTVTATLDSDTSQTVTSEEFRITITPNGLDSFVNKIHERVTGTVGKPIDPSASLTVKDLAGSIVSGVKYELLSKDGEQLELPTGLIFDEDTGVISGTPTTGCDIYNVYIKASKSGFTTPILSNSFRITMSAMIIMFSSEISNYNSWVNRDLTATNDIKITNEGVDVTSQCTYSLDGIDEQSLPAGVTFNTATGQFEGHPTAPCQFTGVKIIATLYGSTAISNAFNITLGYNYDGTNWPGYVSGSLRIQQSSPTQATITRDRNLHTEFHDLIFPDWIVDESYNIFQLAGFDYSCFDSDASTITGILTLNNIITKIPSSAFNGQQITGISLGTSITFIDGYAFNSCKQLSTLETPSTCLYFGSNAFGDCSNLKSLIIHNNNTSNSFRGNVFKNLESITTFVLSGFDSDQDLSCFYYTNVFNSWKDNGILSTINGSLTAQDALQYLINNKGFNNTWTAES